MQENNIIHETGGLLQRLSEGRQEAFSHIYHEYYRALVYFAHTILKNLEEAEDVAAEAFVRLWNARATIRSVAHLRSFLYLGTRHAAIDILRTRDQHARAEAHLSQALPEDSSIEHALAESELLREIAAQVDELPDQCGRVVRHILFDGMTTGEVAKAMNISTKNVLNQKLIAIRKIRTALLKKGLVEAWILFFHFFS